METPDLKSKWGEHLKDRRKQLSKHPPPTAPRALCALALASSTLGLDGGGRLLSCRCHTSSDSPGAVDTQVEMVTKTK